jgi:hypothetical protein
MSTIALISYGESEHTGKDPTISAEPGNVWETKNT